MSQSQQQSEQETCMPEQQQQAKHEGYRTEVPLVVTREVTTKKNASVANREATNVSGTMEGT